MDTTFLFHDPETSLDRPVGQLICDNLIYLLFTCQSGTDWCMEWVGGGGGGCRGGNITY